ncbi:hypothetical protein GQ602_005462 [Ophiocordyceps camponoti-floridani]|uniref:Uncharacterized protein n=1 Tax=Ophiocordyceps camponoti-floridani TaxID=2030778 RepID=A0A8H4Q3D8_9HYPO|nr:hypothetical protein GQ602_005462 [Ophiocordyceps camponoti-floridani]
MVRTLWKTLSGLAPFRQSTFARTPFKGPGGHDSSDYSTLGIESSDAADTVQNEVMAANQLAASIRPSAAWRLCSVTNKADLFRGDYGRGFGQLDAEGKRGYLQATSSRKHYIDSSSSCPLEERTFERR